MFFAGLEKPWWASASIVWVLVTAVLVLQLDYEVLTASRWALIPAAVVAFVVWWFVGRGRSAPDE
jgi:hypothetical protein